MLGVAAQRVVSSLGVCLSVSLEIPAALAGDTGGKGRQVEQRPVRGTISEGTKQALTFGSTLSIMGFFKKRKSTFYLLFSL